MSSGRSVEPFGRGHQDTLRRLELAPSRQVDHHLELGLVVERQQLHRNVLGVEQRAGRQVATPTRDQEDQDRAPAGEQRPRDAP